MSKILPTKTHYSSYNVMDEQEHWDDHTRGIVNSRLEPGGSLQFFTEKEAEKMFSVCMRLTGDERGDIIRYIVYHADQTLSNTIGESERKTNVPKGEELVRSGLSALEQASQELFGRPFVDAEAQQQRDLLAGISEERGQPEHAWASVPQKPFFKKLLKLAVEAYYSHPVVWSEIGYGGPAYPRGYVRTQLGQLDPWEAHRDKPERKETGDA
ncbi:gluconate 2-dehydrogenase subunit 3 family protein [Paenibacillus thermotolerans]|uniref:gluconate 2-dehydrogenase subunit 3 family protein n=1 Tax=Paenibacillus thermotolerans TaxID=3027807 RepID=UPI00236841CE|nr:MULTISPECIES: gluconate 2-dehydrogenase subunit 3 family protein [unclassified Paenibacillus]